MFDIAVKLAALGAAGVCVFVLLTSVLLLRRPKLDLASETLAKWFMGLGVLMAVITATSAYFTNESSKTKALYESLLAEHQQAMTELQQTRSCLAAYKARHEEYVRNFETAKATAVRVLKKVPIVGDVAVDALSEIKPIDISDISCLQ